MEDGTNISALDLYMINCIETLPMGKVVGTSFNHYLKSKTANTPEVLAARAVFASRYRLAAQLMELRERRGFSQSELSRRTGVTQGEISRIERGSGNPTERTLLRLAEALSADLQFVPREDVPAAS